MRIKPATSFPYPIISVETSDYVGRTFELEIEVAESPTLGHVIITAVVTLDDKAIQELIEANQIRLGLMISCSDTYLDVFIACPLGESLHDVSGGQLRGLVRVRAVLVALKNNLRLESEWIDKEFPAEARVVNTGDFVGITSERLFEAGLEKLAPLESVFRLTKSDEISESYFKIDLESEAVEIVAAPALYDTIYNLRNTTMKDVLLSALYLPVIMSVLDAMKGDDYCERRWYSVITARCNAEGIDVKRGELATMAQKLLDGPLGSLKVAVERGDY